MTKSLRYLLLFFLFGLLVLIRFFENELFYDPYLKFFQNDYLYIDSPRREVLKVVLFTSLRFFLNSIVSIGILYFLFRDRGVVGFSIVVYFIVFIVLTLLYLYFVINPHQEDYYVFFNVRRFLIHPIILLLLIPAFYFQKINR